MKTTNPSTVDGLFRPVCAVSLLQMLLFLLLPDAVHAQYNYTIYTGKR